MASGQRSHPLLGLDDADLEFVFRLVMASGSLKDLAASYGVSYPTIRARLDRVIGRLKTLASGRESDPMSEMLARLVERGEVPIPTARAIQELHREQLRRAREEKTNG